jgi:enoyl-CoA hydratase/carnithine racemase
MPHLTFDVREHVGWITIQRPERRNALSHEAIQAFLAALEEADARDAVRVLCVTGAGEQVFCAGADLASAFAGGEVETAVRDYARLLARMVRGRKPIVARVAGHCLAGGMGVLLASDLAVAARRAQFWTPELEVGLFPMMVAALLVRTVGRRRAVEMLYTGRRYDAEEAENMGLITRAVEDDQLDATVERLLASLAGKAPLALQRGRQAVADTEPLALEAALDTLADRLLSLIGTEDAAEGMAAFLQKRAPTWRGR